MTRPTDPTSIAMARLADGDRSAFDPVFQTAWPAMRRFCRRVLADDDRGDDAAQQALLSAFERACEYDPSRPAMSWLLGIAWWNCRTELRRTQRRREASLDGDVMGTGADPEVNAIQAQLEAAVRDAIDTLPDIDATTLWAAVRGEPADRDVPGATFRKRLQRATARLRAVWRERHGTP